MQSVDHQLPCFPDRAALPFLKGSILLLLQVLRFYCVWDDRRSLYGDRRPYRVHYFLEDQTVEVLETNEKNSGRDSFPVFLRRGALPKARHLHFFALVSPGHRFSCFACSPSLPSRQGV